MFLILFIGLNVDLVCCDCCSSDEVSAVRRLLDKVDLQGYQVMDVIKKNLNSTSVNHIGFSTVDMWLLILDN